MKPEKLYHGSPNKIDGPLQPILTQDATPDHTHDQATVFATDRIDLAALFMFPLDTLASIGFEQDIAYICIWGTAEEFATKDMGGYIYVLPSDTFEKIGKDYEWQSSTEVTPLEVMEFKSIISGMVEKGVQVYFIGDDNIFDGIVADKENRAPVLRSLVSQNQKLGANLKSFR